MKKSDSKKMSATEETNLEGVKFIRKESLGKFNNSRKVLYAIDINGYQYTRQGNSWICCQTRRYQCNSRIFIRCEDFRIIRRSGNPHRHPPQTGVNILSFPLILVREKLLKMGGWGIIIQSQVPSTCKILKISL